jgi:hypothetical protein
MGNGAWASLLTPQARDHRASAGEDWRSMALVGKRCWGHRQPQLLAFGYRCYPLASWRRQNIPRRISTTRGTTCRAPIALHGISHSSTDFRLSRNDIVQPRFSCELPLPLTSSSLLFQPRPRTTHTTPSLPSGIAHPNSGTLVWRCPCEGIGQPDRRAIVSSTVYHRLGLGAFQPDSMQSRAPPAQLP